MMQKLIKMTEKFMADGDFSTFLEPFDAKAVLVQPEMDKHLLRIRDNTCLRQGVFSGIGDSKIG